MYSGQSLICIMIIYHLRKLYYSRYSYISYRILPYRYDTIIVQASTFRVRLRIDIFLVYLQLHNSKQIPRFMKRRVKKFGKWYVTTRKYYLILREFGICTTIVYINIFLWFIRLVLYKFESRGNLCMANGGCVIFPDAMIIQTSYFHRYLENIRVLYYLCVTLGSISIVGSTFLFRQMLR